MVLLVSVWEPVRVAIFVESAESATEFAGKKMRPPNEASPPTNSREFNDISFATVPPLKVPVKGTPPIISELFDGTYKRPPKETSEPTRTLLLKLASPP